MRKCGCNKMNLMYIGCRRYYQVTCQFNNSKSLFVNGAEFLNEFPVPFIQICVVLTMVEYSRCYRMKGTVWQLMKTDEGKYLIHCPSWIQKELLAVDDHDILWVWIVAEPRSEKWIPDIRNHTAYSVFQSPTCSCSHVPVMHLSWGLRQSLCCG